jgi:hypothetical protein
MALSKKKLAARQKSWLVNKARRLTGTGFGCRLHVLFDEVSRVMCRPWATRAQGYDLLQAFVAMRGEGEMPAAPAPRGRQAKAQRRAVRLPDVAETDFLLTYEWRRLRMEVIKERGARCECCGATPRDGIRINVDHIRPRRLHPALALDKANLQVLCEACNHGKGNWDQTDWREKDGQCDVAVPRLVRRALP